MAIHLQNIKKYVFYPLIQARVCRVWIPKQNGQATNFNCLFVDRQGGAIQGSAKSRDTAHFSSIITEGDYYEVKNFYTFENRYMNTVVSHEAVIDLKSDTKVTRLNSLPLSIPRYYFNFTDFTHVLNKGKESRLLTDVLGRLKAIQPIEKILVRGQTLEDKREFILENIRGEELRITLWGDIARSFDEASLIEQDSPVIVAFAGFRVSEFRGSANLIGTAASLWYFNPDIPELLAYKHYYGQMPVDLHQLPPSSQAILSLETQINENRRTIREILCMDPCKHKNERFTCKAFIVDYDLFKGWWCESCPNCNKPLSGLPNNLRCMEHDYPTSTPVPWFRINCIVSDGQDVTNFLLSGKTAEYFFNASAHHLVFDKKFTDPFIVPPQMIEKLNKTKIFQLRFGAYKSILSRCEIYVCNIFDDITTEACINPASPIKAADATNPVTTDAGSSTPFTPPTPNLADPLSIDQSQLQTPASQQHTSPQKDTFHDSCHRQSKRALIFDDAGLHDSSQLLQPRPLKDYANSSKEQFCEDDDAPRQGLSKKQRLSISSTEKFANVIGARKDTGEYWRAVMKDQPMPEAIQGLIRATTSSPASNEKADCHTTESNEKNNFVKDFGPQPTATSYDNGIEPAKDKSFSKDFDPKPNVSVYSDGTVVKGERSFAEDFEPRPNVSVYHDDATLKGEKSFPEDFEPRPNVSVYDDGVGFKGKKSFSDDFEPRPSATAYSN